MGKSSQMGMEKSKVVQARMRTKGDNEAYYRYNHAYSTVTSSRQESQ